MSTIILFNYHRWLFLFGSLPLSNLYMYLLCSDMVKKLLSLSLSTKNSSFGVASVASLYRKRKCAENYDE